MSNPFMLSMSDLCRNYADFWQTAANMSAAVPATSMIFAVNSDLARTMRDQLDHMAGNTDVSLIPVSLQSIFDPNLFEPAALTSQDRQEARDIGREEKRGLKGIGPSSTMDTIGQPN